MIIEQIESLIAQKGLGIKVSSQDRLELQYLDKNTDYSKILAYIGKCLQLLGQYPSNGCDPASYMVCVLKEALSIAKSNHFFFIELVEMSFSQHLLKLMYQGLSHKIDQEAYRFFNPSVWYPNIGTILEVYGRAMALGYDLNKGISFFANFLQNDSGIRNNFMFAAMLGDAMQQKRISPEDTVMLTQWAYTDNCFTKYLPWGWQESSVLRLQSSYSARFPINYQAFYTHISRCYHLDSWTQAYQNQLSEGTRHFPGRVTLREHPFAKTNDFCYSPIKIQFTQNRCFFTEEVYLKIKNILEMPQANELSQPSFWDDMIQDFFKQSDDKTGGIVAEIPNIASKNLPSGVVSQCFFRRITIYLLAEQLDEEGRAALSRILSSHHFLELPAETQLLVLIGIARLHRQANIAVKEVASLVQDQSFKSMQTNVRNDLLQLATLGAQGWWLACSFRKNNQVDFETVANHIRKVTSKEVNTINVIFPGQRAQDTKGELANAVKMVELLRTNFPHAEIRFILLEMIARNWKSGAKPWQYAVDYIGDFFPELKTKRCTFSKANDTVEGTLVECLQNGGIVETKGIKIINGIDIRGQAMMRQGRIQPILKIMINQTARNCIETADVTVTASMGQLFDYRTFSTELENFPKSKVNFYVTQQNALELWLTKLPQDGTPVRGMQGEIQKFYSPDISSSGHYEDVKEMSRLAKEYTPNRSHNHTDRTIFQRRMELLKNIPGVQNLPQLDLLAKSWWSVSYILGEQTDSSGCLNAFATALKSQAECVKGPMTVFVVSPVKMKEGTAKSSWDQMKKYFQSFPWQDLRQKNGTGESSSGEPRFSQIKVVIVDSQSHEIFRKILAATEGVSLVTGSNTIIEAAAAGKMFLYEAVPHKLPLIEAYVRVAREILGKKGYTPQDIETFTKIFSTRNITAVREQTKANLGELLAKFNKFRIEYDGKNLPSDKFNPDEWLLMKEKRVEIITETIRRAYEKFTEKPCPDDKIKDILIEWGTYHKLESMESSQASSQDAQKLFSDLSKARRMFALVNDAVVQKEFVPNMSRDMVWHYQMLALEEEIDKIGMGPKESFLRALNSASPKIKDALRPAFSDFPTLEQMLQATEVIRSEEFQRWLKNKPYMQNLIFGTPRLLIAIVSLYIVEQCAEQAGLPKTGWESLVKMGIVIPSAMLAHRGMEKIWESLEEKYIFQGLPKTIPALEGTRLSRSVRGAGSFMTSLARGSAAQAIVVRVMESLGIDPKSHVFNGVAFLSFFLPDAGRIFLTPWISGIGSGLAGLATRGADALSKLGKLGNLGSKGLRTFGVMVGSRGTSVIAALGPLAVVGYAKLLDDIVGGVWSFVDKDADFKTSVGIMARKMRHQALKEDSCWIIKAGINTADAIALTITPNLAAIIERDNWKSVARIALSEAADRADKRGRMEMMALLAKDAYSGSVQKVRYIAELEAFFASSSGLNLVELLEFTKGENRINHGSKLTDIVDSRTGRIRSQSALIDYIKSQIRTVEAEINTIKNALEDVIQEVNAQNSSNINAEEAQIRIEYYSKSLVYYSILSQSIEDVARWKPTLGMGEADSKIRNAIASKERWYSTDEAGIARDMMNLVVTTDEQERSLYTRSIIEALDRLGSNDDDVVVEWIRMVAIDDASRVTALARLPIHLLDRMEQALTTDFVEYHEAILVRMAQIQTGHRGTSQVTDLVMRMAMGNIEKIANESKRIFVIDMELGLDVISQVLACLLNIEKRKKFVVKICSMLDIDEFPTALLLEMYRIFVSEVSEEQRASQNEIRKELAARFSKDITWLDREKIDAAQARSILELVSIEKLVTSSRNAAYCLMRALEENSSTRELAKEIAIALHWEDLRIKAENYLKQHTGFLGLTTDVRSIAKEIASFIKDTSNPKIREQAGETLMAILDRLRMSDDNLVREILAILENKELETLTNGLLTRMHTASISGIKDSLQAYRLQQFRFDRGLVTARELAVDLKDAYGTGDIAAGEIIRFLGSDSNAQKYKQVVLSYFDIAGDADDSAAIAIVKKLQQGNALDLSKLDSEIIMRMYQALTTGWRNETEIKQILKPFAKMFLASLQNNPNKTSREMIAFLNRLGNRDDDVVSDLLAEFSEEQLDSLPEELVRRMYRASSTGWRDDEQAARLQLLMFRKGWGEQESLVRDIISKHKSISGLDESALAGELLSLLDRDPQIFGSVVDHVIRNLVGSNNDDDVSLEIARRVSRKTLTTMPLFLRERLIQSLRSGWDSKEEKRVAEAVENLCPVCDADEYIRYDKERNMADIDYPKIIKGSLPGLWENGIDAAVNLGNGKICFFKGSEYIYYDIASNRAEAGYPQRIKKDWPGLWKSGIDAGVNLGNGKIYFFKGKEYICYNIVSKKVEAGYPQRIKTGCPGLWESGIDAAIELGNNKVCFFKGDKYIHYDISARKADGEPRNICEGWPGINIPRIGTVVNWNQRYIYFFGG